MEHTPINVGRIIDTQLRQCANRQASELIFPSLITQLCYSAGIRSKVTEPGPYLAGTITLVDVRRILVPPAVPAASPSVAPPPTVVDRPESPATSFPTTSISTSASEFLASSPEPQPSASSTSSAKLHVAAQPSASDEYLSKDTNVAPPELYDSDNMATRSEYRLAPRMEHPIPVSDTERPDPPPSSGPSVRRSNRIRARPGASMSSHRPTTRRRVHSPVPLSVPPSAVSAPANLASNHSAPSQTPSPTPLSDFVSVVPPIPATPLSSVPPVPPVPSTSIPTAPVPPVSADIPPSPIAKPVPTPPSAAPEVLPTAERDALVTILTTMAENQHTYFQYAIARDETIHVLLRHLFFRPNDVTRSWPRPPTFQAPSTSAPPAKQDDQPPST